MAEQTIETDLQGVAQDVMKNEQIDESMQFMEQKTPLKQEPLDQDYLEHCPNVYDSYFEVLKYEPCDNSSEMKTLSENHVDPVTIKIHSEDLSTNIKLEPSQAGVSLLTDGAPTLDQPLAMKWMDKASSMGEICVESKTLQSLQKVEEPDNCGLSCGLVTSGVTHPSKKLFTCKHCLYKSVNKKDFLNHVKTHTEEKPCSCVSCNYKCADNCNLLKQLKTHTGEKLLISHLMREELKKPSLGVINKMALPNTHQPPTNMDKQTQLETDLQEVAQNIVIKDEQADELIQFVEQQTPLKQEPFDQDCLDTCYNVYDSYFEVLKHDNISSEVKTLNENHMDQVTIIDYNEDLSTNIKEPPQAAVSLLTNSAPTLDQPLAAMWMDETSLMGEICVQSKTLQSLQKAEDPDNCALSCGLVTSGVTRPNNELDTCKHCMYKGVNKKDFLNHMRIHTGEKPFTCNFCSYKCGFKSYLVRHMRTHTGEKPFTCNVCDNNYRSKISLDRHMRTHTGEKPFTCNVCDNKYRAKISLVSHMRTHTGEKPFTCNVCDNKFIAKRSLVSHMRTHTGVKPFTCKHCDYKSALKSTLTIHMRTHTGEKPFTCNVCNYKFAAKTYLVRHTRTHTGEKPFVCKHCGFKYSDSSYLKIHMRTHTGEKPFSCNHCDYKASRSNQLKVHMLTHTGDKLFTCNHCNFKCTQSSYFKVHMRTHTGEKPFTCKHCDFQCTQSTNLKVHMRTHTGEKPFTCNHCDFKCTQS